MLFYAMILIVCCIWFVSERLDESRYTSGVQRFLLKKGYSKSKIDRLFTKHHDELIYAWVKDWSPAKAERELLKNI